MSICPHCNGERQVFVFADGHHADGTPFHSNGLRNCSTCGGSGEITEEHVRRIKVGRERREERLSAGLSLREASRLAGISAAELSAIECGRPSPAPKDGTSKSGGA